MIIFRIMLCISKLLPPPKMQKKNFLITVMTLIVVSISTFYYFCSKTTSIILTCTFTLSYFKLFSSPPPTPLFIFEKDFNLKTFNSCSDSLLKKCAKTNGFLRFEN